MTDHDDLSLEARLGRLQAGAVALEQLLLADLSLEQRLRAVAALRRNGLLPGGM